MKTDPCPYQGPRARALAALLAWDRARDPLDRHVEPLLAGLSSRDQRLLSSLAGGVLRRLESIDALLAPRMSRPARRLDPAVRWSLRLGAYQLLFMDRMPASAVVNETVRAFKQVARRPRPHLSGFVNAVLRRLAREGQDLALPADIADHPAWLARRWRARYGEEEAARICAAGALTPPLCLRVNTWRCQRDRLMARLEERGISCRPGRYAPGAIVMESRCGPLRDLPGYTEGFFAVQDEAAQLVGLLMAAAPPGRWLDACAGVGGKTTHLAEILARGRESGATRLTAVEPDGRRLGLLRENLRRLGLLEAVELELVQDSLEQMRGQYQGILVDAPCSGTGVIRRHPDIRWNRQPGDIPAMAGKQLALCGHAASLLAPDGVLVYAVCSLEPEEGEELITRLLDLHPELRPLDPRPHLPGPARALVDGQGFLRTTPAQGLDGFFAAILARA